MRTKTTHQMARELLALPDVPLRIEMWCEMEGHTMTASLTAYSDQEAIIWQKPDLCHKEPEEFVWLRLHNTTAPLTP